MSMLDPNEPEAMKRNRCVNCALLMPRNHQVHSLQQASATMITILQSWITPAELSVESILCMECMLLLQDRAITFNADGSVLPLPAFGHRSVCFSYGISILRATRTYTSTVRSNCQERNIILRHVPLHLVSRFERVCGACWMSAYRVLLCLVLKQVEKIYLHHHLFRNLSGNVPHPGQSSPFTLKQMRINYLGYYYLPNA